MIRLPRRNQQIGADFSTRARVLQGTGIKLNFGQLNAAYGDLSRAVGQGPRQNLVDNSGERDLAAGIGRAAGIGMELIERNQQVTDTRKLYDAETRLLVGQQELESLLQNEKDPNKWETVAAAHMDGVLGTIDTEGMSERAKASLGSFTERARMLTVAKARNSGFAKNEAMAFDSANARAAQAAATGDVAGFVQAKQGTLALGANPDVVASEMVIGVQGILEKADADMHRNVKIAVDSKDYGMATTYLESIKDPMVRQDAETLVVKSQQGDVLESEMVKDPDAFVQSDTFKGLEQVEQQKWSEAAFNLKQRNSAMAMQAAQDDMAKGTLFNPVQLKHQTKYKGLTPEAKAVVEERLKTGVPANDPREFSGVARFITDFEPTGVQEDDQLAVADLKAKIGMRFSGAYKAQLDKLADKMLADPSTIPDFGDKILSEAFTEGMLGNYKVPYVQPRKEGWITSAREGTTLTPADIARTNPNVPEGQRLLPGELAEDAKLKAQAAERHYKGMRMIESMRARGEPAMKIEEAARKYVESIGLGASLMGLGPNPIIDMDGAAPRPSMDGTLNSGASPTPANGNPLLPTLDAARDILKGLE